MGESPRDLCYTKVPIQVGEKILSNYDKTCDVVRDIILGD